MAIFLFFKMAAVRHLVFSNSGNFNSLLGAKAPVHHRAKFCQNCQTVVEIWQQFFRVFSRWRPSAILDLWGAFRDHPLIE